MTSKPQIEPIEIDHAMGYSIAIYVSFVLCGCFLVASPIVVNDSLRNVLLWTSATWGGMFIFLVTWRRFTEWLVDV